MRKAVAELIENDEVHPGETVGEPALAGPAFGFEPVDEVDGVEEAAARSGANTASRNGDRQMAFARSSEALLPSRECAWPAAKRAIANGLLRAQSLRHSDDSDAIRDEEDLKRRPSDRLTEESISRKGCCYL